MLKQIQGLHHVTSLASSAQKNNDFFTRVLGLRRVKKTVNFDAPNVYHLYYADAVGTPGTVMTYFPFEGARRGRAGTGEVSVTAFSVPPGSLPAWKERLTGFGVSGVSQDTRFDQNRLLFRGPDGENFALVEGADDRPGWTGNGISDDMAIHGFHSVSLRLADADATAELLGFMGYHEVAREGTITRLALARGNGAQQVDIETVDAPAAGQGAGSVHHVAFAVENRSEQLEVRKALTDAGHDVTPAIDRDYFWAIYFRSPGGVLFEVATNEPGFDRDEDPAHLGEALKLPSQYAHLRETLETEYLSPIKD